jgi:hypothetical protein
VTVGRFELFASLFVVLRGPAGEPLLRTPEQDGEVACRATVIAIRRHAPVADRYERQFAPEGGQYFVLRDRSGRALGFSPLFDSDAGYETAVATTMACAGSAPVVRVTADKRGPAARRGAHVPTRSS